MSLTTRLLSSLVAGIAAAVFATTSSAAPLAYQESVSGDLPGIGALPILTLDIGTNTVSGKFGRTVDAGIIKDDSDSFAFTIPAGAVLTGSFTWGNSAGNVDGGVVTFANWLLFSGSATAYGGTFLGSLSPGEAFPQLGGGLYNFTSDGFFSSPRGVTALADYTFSMTLAATQGVPEPGTLLLAGLALAGLAATRGRRSRARCWLARR